MTCPKLTDQAVDALPLHHGRADLLEEIMSTPVLDAVPVRERSPRGPSRYLVPLAAAAVIVALAAATLWWSASVPDPEGYASQSAPPAAADYRVLLDAPGWSVDTASAATDVRYEHGDASLEITWRDDTLYQEYVADREHIATPPAPGESVQVLGRSGQLWAYSADDHTVIRAVEAGHSLEIRGQGIGRAGYLALLDRLRLVDLDEFEVGLPDRFVTSDERAAGTDAIVAGIADKLGPARGLSPMGTPEPTFASSANSRYDLGADIAGAVACGWLRSYATGPDGPMGTDAAGALATSREWPILREMAPVGDYPEVLWDYADRVGRGASVDGFEQALGCP